MFKLISKERRNVRFGWQTENAILEYYIWHPWLLFNFHSWIVPTYPLRRIFPSFLFLPLLPSSLLFSPLFSTDRFLFSTWEDCSLRLLSLDVLAGISVCELGCENTSDLIWFDFWYSIARDISLARSMNPLSSFPTLIYVCWVNTRPKRYAMYRMN